jgi:hypothetical protein
MATRHFLLLSALSALLLATLTTDCLADAAAQLDHYYEVSDCGDCPSVGYKKTIKLFD